MPRVFRWVDQYWGQRLDVDLATLAPGKPCVVATERRLRPEVSYGFVHALWWLWLEDGRSVVSVPPGAAAALAELVSEVRDPEAFGDAAQVAAWQGAVNAALAAHGLGSASEPQRGLCFAADRVAPHLREDGCRMLTDARYPVAPGLRFPWHCFPDGIVYGVLLAGQVVAVAYAHRTGILEGRVADIGVETASAFRRRGFARVAVRAVVAHIVAQGGEAFYSCSVANHASAATARSAGLEPYGRTLALTVSLATR